MDQKYTSANTSVNKNYLPAVYNKVKLNKGESVLDYGCGKYGILNENGTVGYIDIDDTEKSLSHEMSFEEFALKWAKDTIKKYEN